jgi:thymidylate synthase (FAD)
MYDVMNNVAEKTVHCLDKGHVTLVDVMPRLVPEDQKTADYAIVEAARVSYGDGTKTINEDRGLIRYLMRHSHTTPMEMIEFKFCMKLPICIARQAIRHRTSNVNEVSGRYSVLPDDFYIPNESDVRSQSKTNKQGGEELVSQEEANFFRCDLEQLSSQAYKLYESYIKKGVSREQARMILPVNLYTKWYWKIDLHNLLHFLALRCDDHAQKEIRVFGDAILSLIQPIVPLSCEAWNDYHPMRGAVKMTRLEMESLQQTIANLTSGSGTHVGVPIKTENKREQAEWVAKLQKLGLKLPT